MLNELIPIKGGHSVALSFTFNDNKPCTHAGETGKSHTGNFMVTEVPASTEIPDYTLTRQERKAELVNSYHLYDRITVPEGETLSLTASASSSKPGETPAGENAIRAITFYNDGYFSFDVADSTSNPSIHILKDGATDTASYTYEVKLFRNGNDEDDENPLGTTRLSITGNQDGTISFENVSLEVGSYRVQVKEIPEQGDPPRLAVSDTVESHQMFNGDSVPVLPSGYYHVTFTNVHEKKTILDLKPAA